jgi:HAD superfamily hydrolase (TIGR01509 family)
MDGVKSDGPEAIIFDFFGVICSEIAPFWLGRYFSPEQAVSIKQTLVAEADSGHISEHDLFRNLAQRAGISATQVKREWGDYVRIDADVVRFVREVRQSGISSVALLSNSPSPFLRGILRAHALDHLFDDIIVSSEVGVAKPAPQIYSLALERLRVAPPKAVFVDDNPVNVQAAREIGMVGLLYASLPGLRLALPSVGRTVS